MKKTMILVCSTIEAMMHGVAMFEFSGKKCTAVYTDGTREKAEIPETLCKAMRDYYAYQNENGSTCDAPNTFSLVSHIQAQRPA